MKNLLLIFAVGISCLLGSCAKIIPFTDNIAEKVGGEENLSKFQYYISRTTVLDRTDDNTDATLKDGKAKFVRKIERDKVIINESTPGVVIKHNRVSSLDNTPSDTYRLSVAFESDDDYYLDFKRRDKYNPLYFIVTSKNDWVYYGSDFYQYSSPTKREWLGFGKEKSEEKPYLMIKLNNKLIEKQKKRVAKGRKL